MKYQVIYINYDNEVCETVVDVPNHIPYSDPLDREDVPLYIKSQIEDLDFLEDYTELEAA
jgi:hypothetical protein